MRIALISIFMGAYFTFAQTINIPKVSVPYYDIFEWKGMGAVLMGKEQNANHDKIDLTLVTEKPSSVWIQPIMPLGGKYFLISGENTRYIYFLRSLGHEAGKISFEQLNSAGNIKNTNVNITSTIRSLGFDVFQLQLIDVVVTDKALVHQWRYYDKKEKTHIDIATFVTHHNMLVYSAVIGRSTDEEVKAGRAHHFRFIGFTADEIYFADYGMANNSKGWNVVQFNSKGQEQSRTFIKNTFTKTLPITATAFGTTGANYLGTGKETQPALLTNINGKMYVTILAEQNGEQVLELYQQANNEWKKVNSQSLGTSSNKKTFEIGVYPQNEAMTYKITGGEIGSKTLALFMNGTKPFMNNFKQNVIFNPSRMILLDKIEFFAVTLPAGNLYFDYDQLKKGTDVQFEFIKQ